MRNIFPTSSCNVIHIAQLKMLPSNLDSAHCILIFKPCCLCTSILREAEGSLALEPQPWPECARPLCNHGSPGTLPVPAARMCRGPALRSSHCRALSKAGGFRQKCNWLVTEKSVYFCVFSMCFFPYVLCCSVLGGLAVAFALWVIIFIKRYSFIQLWHDLQGRRNCFQQWNQRTQFFRFHRKVLSKLLYPAGTGNANEICIFKLGQRQFSKSTASVYKTAFCLWPSAWWPKTSFLATAWEVITSISLELTS